jgi:hypothetical protein
MRYLTIDPSTNRIGWALFDTSVGDLNRLATWNFGGLCPGRQGGSLSVKLTDVKRFFSIANADQLICEVPSFFNTERGRIAAREGYTTNLALVIGTIYSCVPNTELYLYTPQQWKGTVPKSVTFKQFKRIFVDSSQYLKLNHDTIDAIMILRFHYSRINRC